MNMRTLCAVLLLLAWTAPLCAQTLRHTPSDFRGDPNYRRNSNVDGNNIRATIFNSGYSGDPGPGNRPDYVEYEWPKNTNRIYISLIGIWLGGEVVDAGGATLPVVDMPVFRTDPAGNTWNMEPVPGFINPSQSQIARSDVKASWPTAVDHGWRDKRTDPQDPGWVGSWDGFFGKDIFNADQELFFVTSDDRYSRNQYFPDTTDRTRRGLGLLMDVRTFAWSQVLINDVLFSIHDIKNDGTKPIDKASFLMFVADFVGGDGTDDYPYVDLQTATTFLTDADRIGTADFGATPVGVASLKYLETPGNQVNGIDDDGDADDHPELIALLSGDPALRVPAFAANDFTARTLHAGDKLVLIDPGTYDRTVVAYPAGGGSVTTLGRTVVLPPGGLTVAEDTVANGLDDDLDGLIDEKATLHLFHINEITQTAKPVRYINYLSFAVGDTIKRGFAVAGRGAAWSYANVAPMIDESRDDGFDNDRDWDAFLDDNGLDGARGTGDEGEGNGIPTSGAGTEFPGESNIDKTDVSETDAIGITSAVQIPVGQINYNTAPDRGIWDVLMRPGNIQLVRAVGEYDTFVSSSFFPLLPGERQRMAISVAIAGGGNTKDADIQNVIKKQKQAELAYSADYQFAQAPLQVTVTAVAGDGQVRLYWDDVAEKSFDRFINKIGGNPRDFEGYRIYRSTDAAFLDAKTITDAYGVKTLLHPIAQFDLADGMLGLHPVDINGVKFDLGNDTGLRHEYVDRGVTNGQRYFYAVTAYDFGYTTAQIPPAESPIQVNVTTDGTITTGSNVVVVRPTAASAGYLPPQVENLTHARGGASGSITLRVVDPAAIRGGETYELTFKDSLYRVATKDEVKTKSFSLRNVTRGTPLLTDDRRTASGEELPVTEGFRLALTNVEQVTLNTAKTGWNHPEVYSCGIDPVTFLSIKGTEKPSDYRVVFGDVGMGTSKDTTIGFIPLPGRTVNFKVINVTENTEIAFAFSEGDGNDGRLSINPSNTNNVDAVYFLERNPDTGKLLFTWQIVLNVRQGSRNPQSGDTLNVVLNKPFLASDVYQFRMKPMGVSVDQARNAMSDIRVVPNPYIAAETWEPRNTYTSGRGPRELHFINLPARCTIRIFNVSGALVKKLEHDTSVLNGTEIWNLLSDENFEIAYGVFAYHIDAPGIGQKTGTFAVIK